MTHPFTPPETDREFERLCVELLRFHWPKSRPKLYGRPGQRQDGIDIIDETGTDPVRAAQAKHKTLGHVLTGKEIRDEVEKARRFRLGERPIALYTVLTSSPRDTDSLQAVIALNAEHRDLGLFEIELLTWDEIEWSILRNHPEIWDDFFGRTIRGLVAPVESSVESIKNQLGLVLLEVQAASGGGEIDAKLNVIKELLDGHEHEAAEASLRPLRESRWSELSSVQRFLTLTYAARAAYDADRWQDSGRLFVLAADFAKDERARTNLAVGKELLGEREEACAIAREVAADFPQAVRPWPVIGRTAPDHVSAEELEAELPSAARADEGTSVALAMRAGRAEDWTSMERLAEKAVEVDNDWAAPPLLLAEAKLKLAADGAYRPAVGSVVSTTTRSIADALEFYDKAVDLAESTRAGWLLRQALLERARARDWSGDDAGADSDYHRALQRFPEQPDVLLAYGRRLLGLGRAVEAIPFLRQAAAPAEAEPEAKHYLAVAFRVAKRPAEDWTPLSVEVAESSGWRHHLDALDLALDGLAKLGRHHDAQALVDRLEGTGLPKPLTAAARAIALRDAGQDEAARTHAIEAAESLSDPCPAEQLRFIAEAQLRADENESALSMFERLASSTRQAPDMWRVIRVARKLERWDVILRTAAEWRAAGACDDDLADAELAVLEHFAPLEAVERSEDELKRRPDDHALILRRSMLGVSLGRLELICRDPDKFPDAAGPDATPGLATVHVLARAGLVGDAVRYAYRLLRNHVRDPKTHLAYAWVMHQTGEVPDEFAAPPPVVDVGAAVRIAEGKVSRWIVIEDEPGDGFGDEMRPDAPFVATARGKGPGDEFLIAGDELDGPRATVLELANKYAFRATQVLTDWQLRFGDEPGVEKFDTKAPGDAPDAFPDILPMVRRQHSRKRHVEAVTGFYREHGVSLWFAADELGAHVADLMASYAAKDDGIIRCGGPERLEDAIRSASQAGAVVLDITALTTCRFIRVLDLLAVLPKPIVTTNTFAELIDHRLEWGHRPSGHVAPTDRGVGIIFQEVDAAAHGRFVSDLDEMIAAAKDRTEILDCRELAELPPSDRDRLSELVGMETAEAILVAMRLGVPLWTDDLFVQLLAKSEFGVESVWTQAVLSALRDRDGISEDRFAELSAKLIGCGYQPTRFNHETFVAACRLADWQASAWPLARLIRHISDPAGVTGDVTSAAASFLIALFDRVVIDSRAEQVATTLLDHLAKLPGGAANVAKVRRGIRQALGIRTLVVRHIEDVIRTWLQIRGLE